MREEIRRLYRHLTVGGVVIIACSYAAMEFTQARFGVSKQEQLLCVDAELSVSLLLSGVRESVPESQFGWMSSSANQLPVNEINSLLGKKEWLKFPDKGYQITLGQQDSSLLVGLAPPDSKYFDIQSLLQSLLLTEKLSYADKMSLLRGMPCLSVETIESNAQSLLSSVTLVHNAYHEYGFLWRADNSDQSIFISILHEEEVPLSLMVILVVGVGITIMLLLIWSELFALDVKRRTFESITRQIARGQSNLPAAIPDSNGTLKELAYSFDSMSSHIERLLKVQREMINAISHELRTPIARLRFGLEVMKDEVDEVAGKTIEELEGDVEELNTLVDEVLTYGKLESGSLDLNFKECSIFEMIEEILRHNHLLLKHLNVHVNVDQDSLVSADEHHLSRALQNLILNAAKYASGNVTVTFSCDPERWQVDIEDDGPGIAFEDRDKVFIPFQRLDNSRTRASGGYGLGLAIVQRIAFWHGGAVLIDASESGGAKFSLIWSRNHHQKTLS